MDIDKYIQGAIEQIPNLAKAMAEKGTTCLSEGEATRLFAEEIGRMLRELDEYRATGLKPEDVKTLKSEVTKLAIESAKRDKELAHLEAIFEWMKREAKAKECAAIEARWEKIVKEGVW